MSWQAVARKDVRDAGTAKTLWILGGLFPLLFVALAVGISAFLDGEFDTFLRTGGATVSIAFPLLAIVLGYKSVIAERDSGSIALLLSLPHSRRDVAIGKFVGRSIVLSAPALVGFAVAAPVVATRYTGVSALQYVGFVAVSLVYGMAFLGIAIGLSMATTASRRVAAGAFGSYVVMVMFWTVLVDLVFFTLFRFRPSGTSDPPGWVPFAKLLNPSTAYSYLLGDGLGSGLGSPLSSLGDAWYTTPPVALLVLLAWVVVPVLVGYRRFDATDL